LVLFGYKKNERETLYIFLQKGLIPKNGVTNEERSPTVSAQMSQASILNGTFLKRMRKCYVMGEMLRAW